MALETATYISDLAPSNPAPTDQLRQADDHLRLIKQTLKNTFPNITGAVTLTQDELNSPSVIPVGFIGMWYGAAEDVPTGWAICDGTAAPLSDGSGTITTPDWRGFTPMGADASNATGTTKGGPTASATSSNSGSHTHTVDGGSHTHSAVIGDTALTEAQLPAHRHLIAINTIGSGVLSGSNSAYYASNSGGDTEYSLDGGASEPTVGRTSAVGAGAPHSHTGTIGSSTHSHNVSTADAHNHSVTVSTYQPTKAVHFIMKV